MRRLRSASRLVQQCYPWLLNGERLHLLPEERNGADCALPTATVVHAVLAGNAARRCEVLPFTILEKEQKQAIGRAWVLRTSRPVAAHVVVAIDRAAAAHHSALAAAAQDLLIDEFRQRGPVWVLAAQDHAVSGPAEWTGRASWQPPGAEHNALLPSDTMQLAPLLHSLGIPPNYGDSRGVTLCREPRRLRAVGRDIYGRRQYLQPAAARAFAALRDAACLGGIALELVSAFRSVEYQAAIVRRKLAQGKSIADILAVSAAPGYSEHHGGLAVDLTSAGYVPLDEVFENSPAYTWLVAHAHEFGFRLSYPRGNAQGMAYEPWHWCYVVGGALAPKATV